MRFIDLRKDKRKSCVSGVLKLGCGPNFVRNRSEAFADMIKDQGVEFWFRFWLTFCFEHGLTELDDIDVEVPGWSITLFKNLHTNFVQAPLQDAINHCWNVVFDSGRPMKRELDEVYQLFALELACALGEVFFKWLVADEMTNPNKIYWAIPKMYLNPNFVPGSLEKFMVVQWGKKLVQLFGVSRHDVKWVRRLLSSKEPGIDYVYNLEFIETTNLIRRRHKEEWKYKLKEIRKAIEVADELRKVSENRAGTKIIKPRFMTQRRSKHTKYLLRPPQCCSCGAITRVRKCPVCIDENWPNPKTYCCISCQSKDWYDKHQKEHEKFMKKRRRALVNAAKQKLLNDSEQTEDSYET